MTLNVREITKNDIPLVLDYWYNSKPEFLISMGVDLDKLPDRDAFKSLLNEQLFSNIQNKKSYPLIWEIDKQPSGHCNVNQIVYGEHAKMHLHLWDLETRRKGFGCQLVKMSIPHFFEKFKLKTLYCEPYALNPAPNKTLKNVGFKFVKTYRTIPGSLNFEQDVNQWKLTREMYNFMKP